MATIVLDLEGSIKSCHDAHGGLLGESDSECSMGANVIYDDSVAGMMPRNHSYALTEGVGPFFVLARDEVGTSEQIWRELTETEYGKVLQAVNASSSDASRRRLLQVDDSTSVTAMDAVKNVLGLTGDTYRVSSNLAGQLELKSESKAFVQKAKELVRRKEVYEGGKTGEFNTVKLPAWAGGAAVGLGLTVLGIYGCVTGINHCRATEAALAKNVARDIEGKRFHLRNEAAVEYMSKHGGGLITGRMLDAHASTDLAREVYTGAKHFDKAVDEIVAAYQAAQGQA